MRWLALLAAPVLLGGCALAALGTVAGAAALGPEKAEATPWRAVDAESGQIQDTEALEQLARDFPDSASVRLRLLTAYLRDGNKEGAREALNWLLARDYAFGPAAQATLATFLGGFDPDLLSRLTSAPPAITRSETFATIPAGARLIEGLAPLGDNDWIATSIVDRALYLKRGEGGWTRRELDGAGSLAGIVVDEGDITVWVASGVYEQTPNPETAFRGLLGWRPDSAAELQRIAARADSTPSDLVLTPDGTLFASDPLKGAIYSARPGDERLRTFVGSGTFRSPQGLVAVDGGRKLLVSDYRYGLATVNLATKAIERVRTALPLALDGIDGMWAHGDRIVAVQNGISPQRILLLTLDSRATEVIAVDVLERGHPDWLEPTGGSVYRDAFYYIASGQWNRFGEGGVARTELPPLPTEIRRIALPTATD